MKLFRHPFFRHPLLVFFRPLRKLVLHQYPYNYSPRQLAVLIDKMDEALSHCPGGTVVEVGCFSGHTTIFLSKHLFTCTYSGCYHAYDTFSGFTKNDIEEEINAGRISSSKQFDNSFNCNDQRWVQWAIDQNKKMAEVCLIKADGAEHKFDEIDNIAFALLDVDLYKPTLNSLNRLWPKVAPGGIIIIDDCILEDDGTPIIDRKFCGGHLALLEWAETELIVPKYLANKLAIIQKPL